MAGNDPVPPGIDRPGVDSWLAAHVAEAVPPFTYEQIMGGGSNLTFRVTDSAGHQWALRRPPMGPILATAHDMGRDAHGNRSYLHFSRRDAENHRLTVDNAGSHGRGDVRLSTRQVRHRPGDARRTRRT